MASSSRDGDGLSIKTLLISSLSAAGAAVIVPFLWESVTLFATAATPIIVALVSDALCRPADRVSQAAPAIEKKVSERRAHAAARTRHPSAGPRAQEPDASSGAREDDQAERRRRRRLKIAVYPGARLSATRPAPGWRGYG